MSENTLYHLSETNLDGKILEPKVPSNFLIQNGYEDKETKRICFSSSIDGCLMAMSSNIKNKEFFVHTPFTNITAYTPTISQVPDVKLTNEKWVKAPCKLKCIGKIKVGEAIDKPLTYKYGDKSANLYKWNYNWIEKYENVTESYVINQKDILYNKDKFDSGEINLCFITGFCGSGKSSLGRDLSKNKVYHYELDDVLMNWNFTDSQLHEYGDLIDSYFKGVGKKYRYHTKEDMKNCTNPLDDSGDNYDRCIITSFVDYVKKYTKSHKDKYVVEGIQLLFFIEPSSLKDYVVYIKGTSLATSTKRAEIRDHEDTKFRASYVSSYIKRTKHWKHNETLMKKWVDYYKDKEVHESVTSAIDDVVSKVEQKSKEKKDYNDMMKLDGVRHPNKIADEVLKTSDKAAAKTMKALDKPASAVNDGANKAIHKTVGGGISLYNKFAKKKIEAEKKRDIEAKAGVAVKGAAFMATKLVPMGPVDWMLNIIAVTKVPTSDDPIDKEVQKVANKAKDTLSDFRREIKKYAEEDRKYASAKQQLKDLERIEGKYEPITKKLALAMDNLNKQKEKTSTSKVPLKPAYESATDISYYTEKFNKILLNSHGELLESSYDLLYDFIYEDGNENYPVFEIVNHYLTI